MKRVIIYLVLAGVFVSPALALEIVTQPNQIWVGTSVRFGVNPLSPSVAVTINWNMGDGSPVKTGMTVDHEYKDPGNFQVQCTLSSGESISRLIQVSERRVIHVPPAALRAGDSISFNPQHFGSNQIRWDFGDGSIENGNGQISHTYINPGTYQVKAFDYNGQSSIPVQVGVAVLADNRLVAINGGPPKANSPAQFRAENFGASSLHWNFGDGTEENGQATMQHIYRSPGTFTVSVKVAGSANASAKTLMVQVAADPRRLQIQPTSPGKYETVSFNTEGFGEPNLLWNFGDGTSVTAGAQVSHAYDRLGNFTVSVKSASSAAPPLTAQIQITQDRRQLQIVPGTVRVGNTARIKALNVKAASVSWQVGNQNVTGTGMEISYKFLNPGVVNVVCTIPEQTPLSANVTVTDMRKINYSPRVVFSGAQVALQLQNGAGPGVRWEFSDGMSRNGGLRFEREFAQPGNVIVKAFDFNGQAQVPVQDQIQVVPDNRQIQPVYQTLFAGSELEFEALRFRDNSLEWDFGDGFRRMGQAKMQHKYISPGQYKVKVVDFHGRDGKNVSLDVQIQVDRREVAGPSRIRAESPVTLELKGVDGDNFIWDLGIAGRHMGRILPGVIFPSPGRFPVRIEDSRRIYPPLTSVISVEPDIREVLAPKFGLPGEKITLEAKHFDGPDVVWDFGDGSREVHSNGIATHKYSKAGRYTFTARDGGGGSGKVFSGSLSIVELTPGFALQRMELAFSSGKAYAVVPVKNQPPKYSLRLQSTGRGILRGQWKLDEQTIGLFSMILRDGRISVLDGGQMPILPVIDVGMHLLTLEFTNYRFSRRIPTLRYFVSSGGAIRLLAPEPGEKIAVKEFVPLSWKTTRTATEYDVAVSTIPFQFLQDRQIQWQPAQKRGKHTIPLSEMDATKWVYWLVRGKNASGRIITTSEIGSFRIVSD